MKKKGAKITKTMRIEDVLKIDENLATIMMGFGLHCFGCPMSRMETLEEAAMVHGVDVDLMVEKLNAALKG